MIEQIRNAKLISIEEIVTICKIFELLGCNQINLTGGEPYLRSDLGQIITSILHQTKCTLKINTNGTYWRDFKIDERDMKRIEFVVSCDTLESKSALFIGRNASHKSVPNFIEQCNLNGYSYRLNCVIAKNINSNISSVDKLVKFSKENNCILKIQSVFDTGEDSFKDYRNTYVDLEYIHEYLCSNGYEHSNLNNTTNGVIEYSYKKNGHEVRLLDKKKENTLYFPICSKCSMYPCDTGMYAHYISSHGKLKKCRTSSEITVDLRQLLRDNKNANISDLASLVKFLYKSNNLIPIELPYSI